MSDWEIIPCDRPAHALVVTPDTLDLPRSFVAFANPRSLPYCTIRVNFSTYQLGLAFHDDPSDLASQLIRECPTHYSNFGDTMVSLSFRHLSGTYLWLNTIAEAPSMPLRIFSITYSASDGLWVVDLPCPLDDTIVDGEYPESLPKVAGVLCFFRGEVAIGVTVAPISQYLNTRSVANSFWTSCKYGVVAGRSELTASAAWWRQVFQAEQNASLTIQGEGHLRWRGQCRSEKEILEEQGWTCEAIESLIQDAYREQGIDRNKVRSVAEQSARLSDGIERTALRSQLTLMEIREAQKRYAHRSWDEDYDPFVERYIESPPLDAAADLYLAEDDIESDPGEEDE